jgi:hypothetical protein
MHLNVLHVEQEVAGDDRSTLETILVRVIPQRAFTNYCCVSVRPRTQRSRSLSRRRSDCRLFWMTMRRRTMSSSTGRRTTSTSSISDKRSVCALFASFAPAHNRRGHAVLIPDVLIPDSYSTAHALAHCH